MNRHLSILAALLAVSAFAAAKDSNKNKKTPEPSAVDVYVQEANQQAKIAAFTAAPGSIWTPGAQFADLGRDVRASQVNDLVTIVVSESASAVSTGATKTQRKSSIQSSITALAGVTKAAGPWANLANMGQNSQIDGSGTTSRQTNITTVLSARVTNVLPNGYLVLEGTKNVQVNSEWQVVTVRGVVRPTDLAADNSVLSNRLAQMEIKLNGKGVVGDAIRRPFILYRLLMGILPI